MKKSIYSISGRDKVAEVVSQSMLMSDVLRYFGRSTKGTGNFSTLKRYLIFNNIPYAHLLENGRRKQIESLDKIRQKRKLKWEEILIENSTYARTSLKRRLINEKVLVYKCSICGIAPKWNGKLLVLELDHINGVFNDNRIDNLRFLCPNCHGQTPTSSGKHLKHGGSIACSVCGKDISCKRKTKLCFSCWSKSEGIHSDRLKRRKVVRPSEEQLKKDISEMPITTIGKKYGVSDNSIRKWIERYNISSMSQKEFRLSISSSLCIDYKNGMRIEELSNKYGTSSYTVRNILLENGLINKESEKKYKHGAPGIYFDSARKDYVCYVTIDEKDKFLKRGFKTPQEAIEYRRLFLESSSGNGQKVIE
jgi:Mor family transcriptional regulator